ncbi:MAG: hypothetical protein LAC70_02010 [Methylovulum sp.]|jgi:hypothetical protein|nr:hypothetical protein [Methylovulum sp.]TSA39757.1 MAG: hypothetical protein D4R63_08300 [Methylococcaceae bacterium]
MSKTSSKSANKTNTSPSATELDDDDDLFETSEFSALPENLEKESIKKDARRKIEIYWEKKMLREQFDDFDESEFGF